MCPNWGPNPQTRHEPWPGIKLATFHFCGMTPNQLSHTSQDRCHAFWYLLFYSILSPNCWSDLLHTLIYWLALLGFKLLFGNNVMSFFQRTSYLPLLSQRSRPQFRLPITSYLDNLSGLLSFSSVHSSCWDQINLENGFLTIQFPWYKILKCHITLWGLILGPWRWSVNVCMNK